MQFRKAYTNNLILIRNIEEIHFDTENNKKLKINLVIGKKGKNLNMPSEIYIYRRK